MSLVKDSNPELGLKKKNAMTDCFIGYKKTDATIHLIFKNGMYLT